jgi:hypothetical protein
MPPSDLLQHVADSIGPIRERLGRLEGDVAHLKRKMGMKRKSSAALALLLELKPLWPYLAALVLITFGHMTADEFGAAVREAVLRWLKGT